MDWNALLNKLIDIIGPDIAKLADGILSLDFVLIVLATITATHILKLIIKYAVRDPNRATLWLALTPLSALLFSYLTWDGQDKYDWIIVGFAAAPVSNLLFWAFLKTVGKASPMVADHIQDPLRRPTVPSEPPTP